MPKFNLTPGPFPRGIRRRLHLEGRGDFIAGHLIGMRERVTRKQGCVYCHSVRLVIEVDGKIHERQKIEDQLREQALMEKGLKILGASLF